MSHDAAFNIGHSGSIIRPESGVGPERDAVAITKDARTVKIDNGDATYYYFGKALVGTATSQAKWLISRLEKSGTGVQTLAYASRNYDQVWDDRTSLSYS